MKKRAGSFLKNMMSKGKNLFKKEEEGKEGGNDNGADGGGFDSEEDNDIIEVRKNSGGPLQMPGNSFSHLSAIAGGNNSSNNFVTHA